MGVANLQLFMSGGAANTNPHLSLGGLISATPFASQAFTAASAITGVTIIYAGGNALGDGTLHWKYNPTGDYFRLHWQENGATTSTGVEITADGEYWLQSDNGGVLGVSVVLASLSNADTSETITIGRNEQNLIPNFTPLQSFTGQATYLGAYLKNTSGGTMHNCGIFIAQQPAQDMVFELGLAPVAVNATMQTIAEIGTPPVGVTFSQPSSEVDSIKAPSVDGNATLLANEFFAVWIKASVPAGQRAEQIDSVQFTLHGFSA